jgi:hypothetical protein
MDGKNDASKYSFPLSRRRTKEILTKISDIFLPVKLLVGIDQ